MYIELYPFGYYVYKEEADRITINDDDDDADCLVMGSSDRQLMAKYRKLRYEWTAEQQPNLLRVKRGQLKMTGKEPTDGKAGSGQNCPQ